MTHWHRILITGSRDWEDRNAFNHALNQRLEKHGNLVIVHGDCPTGADLFARQWAEYIIMYGMSVGEERLRHEAYPALWNELDKAAGPIRNKYMVQLGADECLAFPLPQSRGTIGCMKLAQAAGIPVVNLGTLPEGTIFR